MPNKTEDYPVNPPAGDHQEQFEAAEVRFIRWVEGHGNLIGHEKIGRLTVARAMAFLRLVREGAHWCHACQALGVRRGTLWRWLRRGRQEKKGPYRLLASAVEAAESAAIAAAEKSVFRSNPLAWLARRARSQPGYVGWEPDALKLDLDLSTPRGPLRIERITSDETVEQENERLLASLAILRGLGLANERMLIGRAETTFQNDNEME